MSFKRTFIVSALMVFTMMCLYYLSHSKNIELKRPLSTFPRQIGEWVGKEDRFDQKVYQILCVDDSFLCNYATTNGKKVQLYIGYYESQQEGGLIHSPQNCMPGSGWNIIQGSFEELKVATANSGKVKVKKLLLEKDGQRQLVLYWFQSRGRIIASEYMQKLYLLIDSIKRHRTDDSFVRLITPITDGNERYGLEYLKDFAELLIPLLQEYIPS